MTICRRRRCRRRQRIALELDLLISFVVLEVQIGAHEVGDGLSSGDGLVPSFPGSQKFFDQNLCIADDVKAVLGIDGSLFAFDLFIGQFYINDLGIINRQ